MRKISCILAAALVAAFLLTPGGCARRVIKPPPSPAKAPKVVMVTDVGGLGDYSFNDSAYRGLANAHKDFGCEIDVAQSASEADYEKNLRRLAQEKTDLIVAVGYLLKDAVVKVAPEFPQTKFVIIDAAIPDLPNVSSITFKEEDGSFLAGALAGLVTKTNKLGFIGGMKSPLIEKFEAGFKAGVRTANPKADVLVDYVNSFEDEARAKTLALSQYRRGADIVYHAAGRSGLGVIEACSQMGIRSYVIGVDSNQDAIAPGRVLTSMIKGVDAAVYDAVRNMVRGSFKPGVQILGIEEDRIRLSSMQYTEYAVSPMALMKISNLQRMITKGELAVPDTLEKLAAFKPPEKF